MRNLVVLFVLALLTVGCGAGGGAVGVSPPPPSPPFPFAAGTRWTYRHTQTPTGGPTSVGTLTLVYGGQASYRGNTYHFVDGTTTLSFFAERTYFTWNPVITVRATVLTEPLSIRELVYGGSGIVTIGSAQSTSGVAQCFFNGAPFGSNSWSASSTSAGTSTVTVPAGTFTTTRWNWMVTVSTFSSCLDTSTNASSYAVGNASEVRRDAAVSSPSEDGFSTDTGTYSLELVSGPVSTSEARAQQQATGSLVPVSILLGRSVRDSKQRP